MFGLLGTFIGNLHPLAFGALLLAIQAVGAILIVDWATIGGRWRAWMGHLLGGAATYALVLSDIPSALVGWLIVVGLMHWVASDRKKVFGPPTEPPAPPAA